MHNSIVYLSVYDSQTFKVRNIDFLTFISSIYLLLHSKMQPLSDTRLFGTPAVYCTVLQIHIHCNPLPCVGFFFSPMQNTVACQQIYITIRHIIFTPLGYNAMKFKQKATPEASRLTFVPWFDLRRLFNTQTKPGLEESQKVQGKALQEKVSKRCLAGVSHSKKCW